MSGSWYWPLLVAVLAGGLVPAGYFLLTWRPRRLLSTSSLDAGAWVMVLFALYALAAYRLAIGHSALPESSAAAIPGLVVGAFLDVVLWLRALRWHRFRGSAGADPPQRRSTDEAPPSS